MLLELTVYYFPDDYDSERDEDLKLKPELSKGIIVINTDHIVAFNPHDNGDCMVRLTNGDVFQSTTKFKSFRKIMEGEQIAKDMLVSGDN